MDQKHSACSLRPSAVGQEVPDGFGGKILIGGQPHENAAEGGRFGNRSLGQSLCLSCRRCNLHGWALYWAVQHPPYNVTPGGSYGLPKYVQLDLIPHSARCLTLR